jgi:hypothetical protein
MSSLSTVPTKKKRVLLALCKRTYNRFEAVSGYQGTNSRVCRYWVAPENVERALKVAKYWS